MEMSRPSTNRAVARVLLGVAAGGDRALLALADLVDLVDHEHEQHADDDADHDFHQADAALGAASHGTAGVHGDSSRSGPSSGADAVSASPGSFQFTVTTTVRLCGDRPGCVRSTVGGFGRWRTAAGSQPSSASRRASRRSGRIACPSGRRSSSTCRRSSRSRGSRLRCDSGLVGDADRAAEKADQAEDAEREDQDRDQRLRAGSCRPGGGAQRAAGLGRVVIVSRPWDRAEAQRARDRDRTAAARAVAAAGGSASSTMMRSGRASPATMESMSIWRMWSFGFAGLTTRPRPLKQTVSLPAGVIVTLRALPGFLLRHSSGSAAAIGVRQSSRSPTRLIAQLGAVASGERRT